LASCWSSASAHVSNPCWFIVDQTLYLDVQDPAKCISILRCLTTRNEFVSFFEIRESVVRHLVQNFIAVQVVGVNAFILSICLWHVFHRFLTHATKIILSCHVFDAAGNFGWNILIHEPFKNVVLVFVPAKKRWRHKLS
jgi:hypothetical protein